MLTEFGISRQIFLKFVKVKFHENRPVESALMYVEELTEGCTNRLTDGQALL
jgi:hypothetical protein